jgi:acetyl-CoA carboxylase carboxyltransferase component
MRISDSEHCEEQKMEGKIRVIEEKRSRLVQGGEAKEIERQHRQGKLTARERLQELFDPGTFQEIDLWIRPIKTGFDIDQRNLPGDAVITGFGKIYGHTVYAYLHDFTVVGGTMSSGQDHKVTRLMEMAMEARVPYVGIVDSGGVRVHDLFGRPAFRPIQAGRLGIGGTTGIFAAPSIASGVIPQISIMLGPCYAGSAYSPTLADFVIMRKGTSFMSVASPQLLKTVTFKDVTQDEIGGAELHATTTGTADYLAETDVEAINFCRELITYLPLNNNRQTLPLVETGDDLNRRDDKLLKIVPPELSQPYDMHEVIYSIVDDGQFLELQTLFARSIIIGFARLDGQTVGIVANNPAENKGILNINTCDKEARFIRFCDCFNIPLIFLVDTPGFLSSIEEEKSKDGLIRTAARPVFAICEASVPMIVVYVGKCFGPARLIMGTPRMGVDMVYSWPSAQVSRMDPEEIVNIIYEKEIDSSKDAGRVRKEKLEELLNNHIQFPYHAAEQLMVNEIIDPRDTRPIVIRTLKTLSNKEPFPRPHRKHSLIPK